MKWSIDPASEAATSLRGNRELPVQNPSILGNLRFFRRVKASIS